MQGEVYAEAPSRGPQPFALGEAMDAGFEALERDGVVLTAAHVIAALPSVVVALAARHAFGEPRMLSRDYWVRTLALSAVGIVLGAFFRGGLLRMSLDAARGKSPSLADLARGARFFPAMLAFDVLQLAIFALSVPLLLVPYVVVWMGLALAPFWIVDGGARLGASMRESWRASRGERLHLFGFFVAAAVVQYLGLLVCCVGTFPAAALTGVATAHVYLRLSGEKAQ